MTGTITIIISPDGRTKMETSGFSGSSCKEASQFIKTALGRQMSETFKPEYFSERNLNNMEQSETIS